MSTWDRCITRGVPGSMLPTGYNNAYRIPQTPGLVVILHEMIHEARIIPVTDRAHIDGDVELWTGDARAHREGDTLVVDTTNFNDRAMIVTSRAAACRGNGSLMARHYAAGSRLAPTVGGFHAPRLPPVT